MLYYCPQLYCIDGRQCGGGKVLSSWSKTTALLKTSFSFKKKGLLSSLIKSLNSAIAYIIKQGISASRIVAKGYGEEKLVNECSNGVTCSKDKHQRN